MAMKMFLCIYTVVKRSLLTKISHYFAIEVSVFITSAAENNSNYNAPEIWRSYSESLPIPVAVRSQA
jgi:hypothetical protein